MKKVADSFGSSNDTTTATITADVDSAATDQIPLNQATSAFVTTVLNVLNARRKFLLTTSSVLNESISGYDAEGYATGFVYNTEDQKTVVAAFKVYANYIYNYFSNLNTKVSSIQGLIGKLDACKPPESTPAAKRLLQAPPQGINFVLIFVFKNSILNIESFMLSRFIIQLRRNFFSSKI